MPLPPKTGLQLVLSGVWGLDRPGQNTRHPQNSLIFPMPLPFLITLASFVLEDEDLWASRLPDGSLHHASLLKPGLSNHNLISLACHENRGQFSPVAGRSIELLHSDGIALRDAVLLPPMWMTASRVMPKMIPCFGTNPAASISVVTSKQSQRSHSAARNDSPVWNRGKRCRSRISTLTPRSTRTVAALAPRGHRRSLRRRTVRH